MKPRRRLQRYVVIGGAVYLLEVMIIAVAQWRGASALTAVTLSFWAGLLASFWLQKVITFGDRRLQRRLVLTQLLAVCLLVTWNFGFTLLVTKELQSFMPAWLCRSLALGITTSWNFYLYKTRIFNQGPFVID